MRSFEIEASTAPEATARAAKAHVPTAAAPHVVWHSALLDLSGYAQVARTIAAELERQGTPLRVAPIFGAMKEARPDERDGVVVEVPTRKGVKRFRSDLSEAETRFWLARRERADVRSDVVLCHNVPASTDGRDLFADMRSRHPGAYFAIGSTMFETDRIPSTWVGPCDRMDEIWVPTSFNLETFAKSGVDRDRLRVMPFGVAPIRQGDVDPSYRVASTKSFKFLSVFELTKRKGWDVLLRAWVEAFDADDDVALIVKTYGRRGVKPLEVFSEFLASIGRDVESVPEIVLIEDRLTDAQMRGLYAQCDAFVLPSRGEGWGMPYQEAQLFGLPTIATRWSGQTEFLNDENAFLIDVERLAPVDADQVRDDPIYEGHLWAEPSVASTVESLRRVAFDPPARKARALRGAADASTVWTAERAAARMTRRLEEIEARRRAVLSANVSAPAEVVWHGPFASPSGYGSEARAFIRALSAFGEEPALRPVAWDLGCASLSRSERDLLHALARREGASTATHVVHAFAEHFTRRGPGPNVARTMFETDRLPDGWAEALSAADEVWVPSRHNAVSFENAGVPREKIAVVPGTIDMDAYAPFGDKGALDRPDRFVFLSVFEWSARKAPEKLVAAFVEEFAGRDDVSLALRVFPPTLRSDADVEKAVRNMAARATPAGRTTPPITMLAARSEEAMPAMYRGADAFVLPTRGEGFGRPFLEAAAVGLPTIATRWGGQLDFLDDATAYLVDARVVDVPERAWNDLPRFKGHRWAEPDLGALRSALRRVFEDRAAAAETGRRAAASVRRTHAPARIAEIVRERTRALRSARRSAQ
jgi:glycosyltransferase involved in cell wall biosynthesis